MTKKEKNAKHNRLNALYQRKYSELLRRSEVLRRRDPRVPLGAWTVVHKAWMRMARAPQVADTSTDHFLAIASRQMKRIRIEAFREGNALRRRGHESELREELLPAPAPAQDSLDLERAFAALDLVKPRVRAVAERYLVGGYTVREVARELGVSESVVDRDLKFARAFICRQVAS